MVGLVINHRNSVGDAELFSYDNQNVKIHAGVGGVGNLDLRADGVVTISGGNDFAVSGGDITMGGSSPSYWLGSAQDTVNVARLYKAADNTVYLKSVPNNNIVVDPRGGFVVVDGIKIKKVIVNTTDTTINEFFTSTVENNSVKSYSLFVNAFRTDEVGECASFKFDVSVFNNNGVYSLIGSPFKTVLGRNNINYDVDVDISSNLVVFGVMGDVANNITWIIKIEEFGV